MMLDLFYVTQNVYTFITSVKLLFISEGGAVVGKLGEYTCINNNFQHAVDLHTIPYRSIVNFIPIRV